MCYQKVTRCASGPQPGSFGLMDAILFVYGDEGASSWGIFNCRNTNTPGGSSTLSVHAGGRAGDVRISPNGAKVGYTLAEILALYARELELQFIIWARKKWGCSYSPVGQKHKDWLSYGGYAHLDHIHWEQNLTGAAVKREVMRARAVKLFTGQGVDEMTPDQEAKLDQAIALSTQALEKVETLLNSVGHRYVDGPTLQKALIKDDPLQPGFQPQEHLTVIDDKIDAKFGDVEKRLIRIEEKLNEDG